jgi:hypothetical protein
MSATTQKNKPGVQPSKTPKSHSNRIYDCCNADKNKSLSLVYTNISATEGTKVSSQWSRLNSVIFISMVGIKFSQLLLAAAEERLDW